MTLRMRSNSDAHLQTQQFLANALVSNIEGFPALPDDVHLEIVSYFPALPVPTRKLTIDVKGLRDRHLTLLSLSQTCRSLRPFYLRYLWQRIEVFDGMETNKGSLKFVERTHRRRRGETNIENKLYVEELLRQLEIVTIRDSSLAMHVNILNLVVVEDSAKTVLPELARCIALLPNLHTVQFDFRLDIIIHNARKVFSANRYPQIRTACLSQSAYFFLASCPNVRHVLSYMDRPGIGFLEDVILHCPQVEVLAPLFTLGPVQRMLPRLKNLRDVSVDCIFLQEHKEDLELLSQMPCLHTIRITTEVDGYSSSKRFKMPNITEDQVNDWVEWARGILSGHETREVQRVIVVYQDGRKEKFVQHLE